MSDRPGPVFHLVAPRAGAREVLVRVAGAVTAGLPQIQGPERLHDAASMTEAVAGLVGHEVPILRIAPIDLAPRNRPAHVLVEVEPLPDTASPPGCAWLPLEMASADLLGPPETTAALDRWLAEQRTGTLAPRRPSWSRPGFLERARGWMVDRLAEAGSPVLAPPRLTHLWGLSAILRTDTPDGAVFLKSCARVFPLEPAVTAALDAVAPGTGPTVVARDDAEGWLLMRDAGGEALGDALPERWVDGLTALGRLQRAWPSTRTAIELEDRGPERLAAAIPGLVADPLLADLPDETRERLEHAVPRLLDACRRIARLGPGPTIVHGDFHPWNVHRSGDRTAIIDWSDACAGHPFFDLVTYVGRTHDVAARRALVAAFLDGWSAHGSRTALEEAARLALPLGALHQAESYRRIVASLEPDDHWDLAGAAPSQARRALEWLDGGLDADMRS